MRRYVAVFLFSALVAAAVQAGSIQTAHGQTSILVGTPAERQAEARIRDALLTTITGNWFSQSLEFALIDLRRQLGVDVQMDIKALDEIGISGETEVRAHIGRKTAREALDILTRSIDPSLTWTIQGGSLWITTKMAAQGQMSTRVYPVGDLVVLFEGEFPDFDPLIELIQKVIDPESWDTEGGPGAIQPLVVSTVIVCTQTRDVHEQIENLLVAIRQAQEPARAVLDAYQNALRDNGLESDIENYPWDYLGSNIGGGPVIDHSPAPWRVPQQYDN